MVIFALRPNVLGLEESSVFTGVRVLPMCLSMLNYASLALTRLDSLVQLQRETNRGIHAGREARTSGSCRDDRLQHCSTDG